MIKVLIADDHDMVRQSIILMLGEIDDIIVTGEAKSGEEAVKLAKKKPPNVVLMDVRMPGIGGFEATKRILAYNNSAKIIALSGYNDGTYPAMFMQAGAMGYITKDAGVDDMVEAIRQVHQGEPYLSSTVAERVAASADNHNGNPFDALSQRELQIALMLVECYAPAQIEKKLNLSTKAINSYRYRICEKLNINSDIELTLIALRHGMIEPPLP